MIIKIDDEVTVNNRGSFRSGKITDISLSLLTNDPAGENGIQTQIMIGEERFITAILTQAVEDASYTGTSKKYLKHKVDAIDWLLNKDSEDHDVFLNYCTMLGLSPSRIQDKVRTHLNPKMSTKQKTIMKGLN
jgi:hypothetical protein